MFRGFSVAGGICGGKFRFLLIVEDDEAEEDDVEEVVDIIDACDGFVSRFQLNLGNGNWIVEVVNISSRNGIDA